MASVLCPAFRLKGMLIYSTSGTGGTPSSASDVHEKVNGEAFLEKQRG